MYKKFATINETIDNKTKDIFDPTTDANNSSESDLRENGDRSTQGNNSNK